MLKQEPQDDEELYGLQLQPAAAARPPPAKKKRTQLYFTQPEEQELAEWFRQHPCLYDLKCRDAQDRSWKEFLYEEKAREYTHVPGCNPNTLQTWFRSLRTIYGKLSKRRDAGDRKRLTQKEKWLLREFSFLKPHVVRRRNYPKPNQQVSSKARITSTRMLSSLSLPWYRNPTLSHLTERPHPTGTTHSARVDPSSRLHKAVPRQQQQRLLKRTW